MKRGSALILTLFMCAVLLIAGLVAWQIRRAKG